MSAPTNANYEAAASNIAPSAIDSAQTEMKATTTMEGGADARSLIDFTIFHNVKVSCKYSNVGCPTKCTVRTIGIHQQACRYRFTSKDEGDKTTALVDRSGRDESDAKTAAPAPVLKPPTVASRPRLTGNKKKKSGLELHTCVQSMVGPPRIRSVVGVHVCTPDKPAELEIKDVKVHYVMHYLHRGYWNAVVPEPTDEDKSTIDAYICNICQIAYRNNLPWKMYSARGSFLYHLATEHGKIVDAMREDSEVDMTSVIELLAQNDPTFKRFVVLGTKTAHDSNLVTIVKKAFDTHNEHKATRDAAAAASSNPEETPMPSLPDTPHSLNLAATVKSISGRGTKKNKRQ